MTDPAKLISAAEEIAATFEALLPEIIVNDAVEARVAASLFLTIAELYIGVIALLRSRAQTHAPVLIRSMHEAVADLNLVIADPAYADQMRYDNADQMLKTFKGFQDAPDMKDQKEAQETLAKWIAKEQTTYDELKAKGFKSLSAATKFNKAGMAGEYATGYRFLCSFSHNDLNMLVARHGGDRDLHFV